VTSDLRARIRPHNLLGVHPGLILAVLDTIGLLVAGYLSIVELGGGVPTCGPIKGCEEVALSEYARVGGVPVAVFGVALSLVLLALAVAWWRSNLYGLLLAHYALSLVGVVFDAYFLYLQVFVIEAVCIWCVTYEMSLLLRFAIAALVYFRSRSDTGPIRDEG
jgi:uncharacterized membrane protein